MSEEKGAASAFLVFRTKAKAFERAAAGSLRPA